MTYVYLRSEPALWTVGYYLPDGKWEPESDHGSADEAARRTAWLNGSPSDHALLVEQRDQALAENARLRDELRDAGNDLLDVRGILSPNGHPRRVPMELVPTVAPAVKWLADEADRLRAKLDEPCGSCHPCTNWADETWRRAGRKPPTAQRWDEVMAELAETRTQRDAAKTIADELRNDLRAADEISANLQQHIAAIRAEATA